MTDIRLHVDAGIATLTLDAPARRNALTPQMARDLIAACDKIDSDPDVGAVVVRGEGGYFCAGGDRATLAAAGADPADPVAFAGLSDVYGAFVRVGELEPPTIAAVCGGAVGAGMNLLLACDLRVVAADARLASGFLPIALHHGGGHGALLGRLAGRETTAAMVLFGEGLDGRRAAGLGLAWEAVEDPGDVDGRALALAAVPAADPELARRTARSLRLALGPPALSWPVALEVERPAQMWSMRRKAQGI